MPLHKAIVAALIAATALPAQSLLVLSKQDHTLAIIDPTTLQVIAKAPVGNDPHEVIASSDGTTAYVSNYGFGAFNTLAVIDLTAKKPLPEIDLGPLHGPHGLTFAGGKLWFTVEANKAVGRYDPATKKVDWVLGTGQNRTHMIDVSADLQHIVTSNVSSGTVSLIDQEELHIQPPPPPRPGEPQRQGPGGPPPNMPHKDWSETVVKVGNGSEGFDLSPDRKQIWVANAQDATISIIDVATKAVIATLHPNVEGANRLKFTPDGTKVLVSTHDGIAILDANTRKEVKRLPIGGAAGILVQPDGTRAFIACGQANYVAVIDLHTFTLSGKINAGGEPDGMAWASHP
ncbi:YncE family protein [Granulicella arctica]|uniref:YncE family protein n=1 Tax=Granulicella arctica TaxID=940613 RepID=UPI0021E06BDC|nr:YncE family protein [Granulicella arctica]